MPEWILVLFLVGFVTATTDLALLAVVVAVAVAELLPPFLCSSETAEPVLLSLFVPLFLPAASLTSYSLVVVLNLFFLSNRTYSQATLPFAHRSQGIAPEHCA